MCRPATHINQTLHAHAYVQACNTILIRPSIAHTYVQACNTILIRPSMPTHMCRENRTKYIQYLSDEELHYNQTKYFHWDGNNSFPNASADDTICTINIPMVVSMAM